MLESKMLESKMLESKMLESKMLESKMLESKTLESKMLERVHIISLFPRVRAHFPIKGTSFFFCFDMNK